MPMLSTQRRHALQGRRGWVESDGKPIPSRTRCMPLPAVLAMNSRAAGHRTRPLGAAVRDGVLRFKEIPPRDARRSPVGRGRTRQPCARLARRKPPRSRQWWYYQRRPSPPPPLQHDHATCIHIIMYTCRIVFLLCRCCQHRDDTPFKVGGLGESDGKPIRSRTRCMPLPAVLAMNSRAADHPPAPARRSRPRRRFAIQGNSASRRSVHCAAATAKVNARGGLTNAALLRHHHRYNILMRHVYTLSFMHAGMYSCYIETVNTELARPL